MTSNGNSPKAASFCAVNEPLMLTIAVRGVTVTVAPANTSDATTKRSRTIARAAIIHIHTLRKILRPTGGSPKSLCGGECGWGGCDFDASRDGIFLPAP